MKKRVENNDAPLNGASSLTKFVDKGERLSMDEGDLASLKVSLADKVANYLREAIFRGKIAPGEQLREVPLSQALGISRGPIRDAFSRLEREGLVTIPRNGRTIVARLTREDFDEVYSLRLGLERVAMQYAIRNGTAADLDEMQRMVDVMVAHVDTELNEKDAADMDLEFHDVVYQASRHKRLQSVWADLRPQIYIFLLSRNVADSDFRVQMGRHQEIVDVIRAGDEVRAMDCIERHIQFAYNRIIKIYT
ncbi:MAG: GntR family transcriptional regulator [Anaerolineae bacterium]|nr:GntR family transcriptional regulator [Anaerolineae bacterium]